jgi:creatinine amidohydrolase
MKWEELTSADFKKAVMETGVCILALGVIEKHSEHLPLGTDFLNAHKTAVLAAEKEPAIVFPPFYFGQIYEARCFPGTVTVKPQVLLELLHDIFAEISRNGIKKIILYNGHGGNTHMLYFLAQLNLSGDQDYTLYLPREWVSPDRKKEYEDILDVTWGGHAHEAETSCSLVNFPDLVKMERVPKEAGTPKQKLKHLENIFTGISWYSDYPDHYSGEASKAAPEKGEKLRQIKVDTLAEYIKAVKEDETAPALIEEFQKKSKH